MAFEREGLTFDSPSNYPKLKGKEVTGFPWPSYVAPGPFSWTSSPTIYSLSGGGGGASDVVCVPISAG